MFLGKKTKTKKGTSIRVDYVVHVEEIKPWLPSRSSKSQHPVLLQWENGERQCGYTKSVVPSIDSSSDSKIEFNESFILSVTLSHELSAKGVELETFQKNYLELNLYETRKGKAAKGQILGTVVIDLAEYGVIKDPVNINASMNCKRSFRNSSPPVLYMKIQSCERDSSSSSSGGFLPKENSLEKDDKENSALINEENIEEAEIASFTDDDASSHCSQPLMTNSPPHPEEENADSLSLKSDDSWVVSKLGEVTQTSSSTPVSGPADAEVRATNSTSVVDTKLMMQDPHGSIVEIISVTSEEVKRHHDTTSGGPFTAKLVAEVGQATPNNNDHDAEDGAMEQKGRNSMEGNKANREAEPEAQAGTNGAINGNVEHDEKNNKYLKQNGDPLYIDENFDDDALGIFSHPWRVDEVNGLLDNNIATSSSDQQTKASQSTHVKQVTSNSARQAFSRGLFKAKVSNIIGGRKHGHRSAKSVPENPTGITLRNNNQFADAKKGINSLEFSYNNATRMEKMHSKLAANEETGEAVPDSKIQELVSRIERLESELREAAIIEAALYSVVAEHGSSVHKVHTPARRLSRMYIHAHRNWSREKRVSAARSIASGMVLAAKACGNDVPRLMYWLSNSVVLRILISQVFGSPASSNLRKRDENGYSDAKWKDIPSGERKRVPIFNTALADWQDPSTFTAAIENIECWIFSRIVESVWWQTLTLYMQYSVEDGHAQLKKSSGKMSTLGNDLKGNFSINLWKSAFRDSFERLCPVRAGGHECGCLPVLPKLVMQQCVARLDVAMFNAILRESADDIPMDPVSDPISGYRVLPISCQNLSFGAGAQLKNAIGTWSRYLADLFGIDDDDDSMEVDNSNIGEEQNFATSCKSFHLLNALSDLLMLPKDLLLDASIRKEVCPTFAAPLLKRILLKCVPDEFCPGPVSKAVLEALDSEITYDQNPRSGGREPISSYPCIAAPIKYSPPSRPSVSSVIGDVQGHFKWKKNAPSVLRKCPTSDDELDELETPLTPIFDRTPTSPTQVLSAESPPADTSISERVNSIRYQLLREVWCEGD
ncbi:uncharacterized protein LOC116249795 [Nymphaea colorata]|nr:uncharacterized protein LOC116249795 [Nymphaea colorata]XP_049932925.1 uncharacterized protein LOC116249795 [Nymphaea colorata]XP_049932926.1 uncharacterized protein LOC116249795 [Nymphaea colorata]XP_049932927.1 uncharacterized protein LOC116249795 [Nymphaea colorata]XP_049932928.1 uncharacterized protein LOC116249795 [Nymphaea colorata]XP_049932929.1 uncharacterized protein LOC116249795 [Nymphaea colorata]